MQNTFSSVLEGINRSMFLPPLFIITIPMLLLAFGVIKIRKWHRENIIKSKGIFNLAILILIVVGVVMMNFMYISLNGRTGQSYTMTIIFLILTLMLGWITFLLATIKSVASKRDDTDEVMVRIFKREIKDFILWTVIIPSIAVFLVPTILFAIVMLRAKFFE